MAEPTKPAAGANQRAVPSVSPTPAQAEPDRTRTEDVAKRAQETEGKNPADLDGAELLKAAVKGELSTDVAPVRPVVNPEDQVDDDEEAENGLPYVGTDEQFKTNPELVSRKVEEARKERRSSERKADDSDRGSRA